MTSIHWAPDNGEVHHYTDTGGLIGIIQDEKFWATNIRFMNDSLEYESGLRKTINSLNDALKRLKDANSGNASQTQQLDETVQAVIGMLMGAGTNPADGQYVCCFSYHYDDLGQWRGYAKDGYCITFDRDELKNSLSEMHPEPLSVRHGNIDYGLGFEQTEARFSDAVLHQINEILHSPDVDFQDHGFSENDPIFGEFVRGRNLKALATIRGVSAYKLQIPFLKEEGFAAEQEMRTCVSQPDGVNFRPSKIGPIPYIELKFDPMTIKSVTVGPGLNIELRKSTLEYFLEHKFGKNHEIQVKTTELSFRG